VPVADRSYLSFPPVLARVLHARRPACVRSPFRFSGGFAGPRESATGRVSRLYAVLATGGVHVYRRVSTAVVSVALARSTGSYGGRFAPTFDAASSVLTSTS
jgi:hypothetical protein